MKFDEAAQVESVCYDLKLADYSRGKNRARINNLMNGVPPFDETEAEANGVLINVNFLEGTRLTHDARQQFYGAFLKPGRYFAAACTVGAKHKRVSHSAIVTKEINRIMKRSLNYFETFRSKFALNVLHGIGPAVWRDGDKWCPDALGVEDVGIPSGTLLTMENLPFFYIYRSYTVPELIKLTRGPKVDPAWNMEVVDAVIKQIDTEATALMSKNWPEVWSPEKTAERMKGDGGHYASDRVPTIDCFDFYFWSDEGGNRGWRRRIILDAWSTPDGTAMGDNPNRNFSKGKFLYDSKDRIYAKERSEIVSFQFADLSAVAPFRYHSVRSLGFLVYAVCHLQNRMRCKFNESVFESLMNYFRVKSSDDADRALKVELMNRGFIDETIQFVPPNERWQVNAGLVELGLAENTKVINANTADYIALGAGSSGRKTKFEVMAEQNKTVALTAAALNQSYQYQEFEYAEIVRRFFKEDSGDPDVKEFQERCTKQGVPKKMLQVDNFEITPERVMGAGNKSLEMTISEQLMAMRPLYDPESQRQILHDVTLAITDDPARADQLVPESPLKVSDTIHDAQLAAGALLQGLPVAVRSGQNHQEYVMVMLKELELVISRAEGRGGMATAEQIEGFNNMAQHLTQHIEVLAADKNMSGFVADANKQLGKLMNYVRAFQQRLEQEQQKQQQAGGGVPPEEQAKLQAMIMAAKTKSELAVKTHSQKTAQKQLAWELEQKRKQEAFQQQLAQERAEFQQSLAQEQVTAEQELELAAKEQELKAEGESKASAEGE